MNSRKVISIGLLLLSYYFYYYFCAGLVEWLAMSVLISKALFIFLLAISSLVCGYVSVFLFEKIWKGTHDSKKWLAQILFGTNLIIGNIVNEKRRREANNA